MKALVLFCLAVLSLAAHAAPVDVDADLIWDDNDARAKCPQLCSARHLYWIGTWRKVGWMDRPVCACDDKAPPAPAAPPISITINPPGAGAALPAGAVTRYDNADFPGRDIRNQPANSFEQCAAMCLGSADCGAFTFAVDTRRCFEKSGMGESTATRAAVSGVVNRSGATAAAVLPLPASGPSCSVGGTAKCPGCSITCSPGQTPVCEHAVEGVTSACAKNTVCRCG